MARTQPSRSVDHPAPNGAAGPRAAAPGPDMTQLATARPQEAPAAGPPARPEPTRAAVLAAFHRAAKPAQPAAPPVPRAAPAAAAAGQIAPARAPAPVAAIAPAPPPVAPPPAAAVLARSVSRSAPALAPAPFAAPTLQRVVGPAATAPETSSEQDAVAGPVDIEALAEFVLERLRDELRDGRERLGFLLDDAF